MKLGIYFTLGDFGVAESVAILKGAAKGGAKLLEVGLPFSDPLLDGPVIQASHNRALQNGEISWIDIAEAVSSLKNYCNILGTGTQISLMTSAQLLYDQTRTAALPHVDGFLITDIAHDRKSPVGLPSPRVWFLSQDVALNPSFCSPPEDISMVYLTRVQGITGVNQKAADTTAKAIEHIKKKTSKPVWLGFGITNAEDLKQCQQQGADGGIVGSAFVKALEIESQGIATSTPQSERCEQLGKFAQLWVEQFSGRSKHLR